MSPRLFSYVISRDFGFAPNPFHGYCTLATCKPKIRSVAKSGDWVAGTGSSRYGIAGHLVYAMRIDEILTFEEYWTDPRFAAKRPNLHGTKKVAFGDNIYHRELGCWIQADSHHSLPGGKQNHRNIKRDTGANRVLIGSDFAYCGGCGPKIPLIIRRASNLDICCPGVGHRSRFPGDQVRAFVEWFRSLKAQGCLEMPAEWKRNE